MVENRDLDPVEEHVGVTRCEPAEHEAAEPERNAASTREALQALERVVARTRERPDHIAADVVVDAFRLSTLRLTQINGILVVSASLSIRHHLVQFNDASRRIF